MVGGSGERRWKLKVLKICVLQFFFWIVYFGIILMGFERFSKNKIYDEFNVFFVYFLQIILGGEWSKLEFRFSCQMFFFLFFIQVQFFWSCRNCQPFLQNICLFVNFEVFICVFFDGANVAEENSLKIINVAEIRVNFENKTRGLCQLDMHLKLSLEKIWNAPLQQRLWRWWLIPDSWAPIEISFPDRYIWFSFP